MLVGLVAHNNLKGTMINFVKKNIDFFKKVRLVSTGSTGRALSSLGLKVDTVVSSGPLGGDQEIGSLVVKGQVAALFFFTDPLSSHPHEADIAALNRLCCVHDTPFSNNPSTSQALVHSLEYSEFAFARLTGTNHDYQKDSDLVLNYKMAQQKVIQDLSGGGEKSPNNRKKGHHSNDIQEQQHLLAIIGTNHRRTIVIMISVQAAPPPP